MNVAWVTPYVPAPVTTGGAIRQHRLAEALASHAEVHLFARGEPWEGARLRGAGRGPFASTWVGRDYWPRSPRLTGSKRIRRGSPASLYRAVTALHRRVSLDLLVVSHSWAALGAAELGVPWLLDEHNIESRYFAEMYRAKCRSGRLVERELSEMAYWERRVWASCPAVTCVSDDDAGSIARHRRKERPLVVVQNGAVLPSHDAAEEPRSGVVFVGSMHHAPNVEAARRLAEHILPRVWSEWPDVSLTVVGGPVPRKLAPSLRVRLPGVVPDVRPFLSRASVFANPLSHGAGSSLKIVEALAAGVPVVSSEVGARGFDLVPGRHYLLANTDEEQAQAILRLLQDPELAERLAEAGRREAERYDWARLGDRFVELALRAAHT